MPVGAGLRKFLQEVPGGGGDICLAKEDNGKDEKMPELRIYGEVHRASVSESGIIPMTAVECSGSSAFGHFVVRSQEI